MSKEPISDFGEKQPTYWWVEQAVGASFNRLKGKLYNLVEATITEPKQLEAVKGLIKDFANSEFVICLENMRYEAKLAKLIGEDEEGEIPPLPAYALESRLDS